MAAAVKPGSTVRISEKAYQTLRELSSSSGEPVQTVLDEAVEYYRRQRFFDECDAAYAEMRRNPEAWAEYQKELALWDCVSCSTCSASGCFQMRRFSILSG